MWSFFAEYSLLFTGQFFKLSRIKTVMILPGVYDESRMGTLCFKLQPDGLFLDDNRDYPTPHWSDIRELPYGASIIESDEGSQEASKCTIA
jgi:hypothetical protein